MGYLSGVLQALVSPVNCVANLVSEVATSGAHFVQCVGSNLVHVTSVVTTLPV